MSSINITFGTSGNPKFKWFDNFGDLTDGELIEAVVHCRSATAAFSSELYDRRNPRKDQSLEDHYKSLLESSNRINQKGFTNEDEICLSNSYTILAGSGDPKERSYAKVARQYLWLVSRVIGWSYALLILCALGKTKVNRLDETGRAKLIKRIAQNRELLFCPRLESKVTEHNLDQIYISVETSRGSQKRERDNREEACGLRAQEDTITHLSYTPVTYSEMNQFDISAGRPEGPLPPFPSNMNGLNYFGISVGVVPQPPPGGMLANTNIDILASQSGPSQPPINDKFAHANSSFDISAGQPAVPSYPLDDIFARESSNFDISAGQSEVSSYPLDNVFAIASSNFDISAGQLGVSQPSLEGAVARVSGNIESEGQYEDLVVPQIPRFDRPSSLRSGTCSTKLPAFCELTQQNNGRLHSNGQDGDQGHGLNVLTNMVDSQPQPKRQRIKDSTDVSLESSGTSAQEIRSIWKTLESVLARIQVLEESRPDHFDRERLSDVSSHDESATLRVLYKTLEAALTRISILETKSDISYYNGFKMNSRETCIVRGCDRTLARADNAFRHLKDSPGPQHQVAAIILGQTRCLQCDRDFPRPTVLKDHEKKYHNEAYTSRMEIFSPFFQKIHTRCIRNLLELQPLSDRLHDYTHQICAAGTVNDHHPDAMETLGHTRDPTGFGYAEVLYFPPIRNISSALLL